MTNNRKACPMRNENGNCLAAGGFCISVNVPICEALHHAYDCGQRDFASKLQKERENPEPLTIEELRKVDGEPVWTSRYGWRICYGTTKVFGRERIVSCHGDTIDLFDYGINWLAYKSEPKENVNEQ